MATVMRRRAIVTSRFFLVLAVTDMALRRTDQKMTTCPTLMKRKRTKLRTMMTAKDYRRQGKSLLMMGSGMQMADWL
jgi:hypothetical protein